VGLESHERNILESWVFLSLLQRLLEDLGMNVEAYFVPALLLSNFLRRDIGENEEN